MLRIRRPASALIVSTLVLFAGCRQGQQDGVVATVNGHPIMRTDVDKLYTVQLASNPQQPGASAEQADATRLQILQ